MIFKPSAPFRLMSRNHARIAAGDPLCPLLTNGQTRIRGAIIVCALLSACHQATRPEAPARQVTVRVALLVAGVPHDPVTTTV